MSHHSDDQLLQAGSDSFWEPGNFKRTTKRIEDGYKLVVFFFSASTSTFMRMIINIAFFFQCRLCTDLQTLLQERAEIEKGYAKSLRTWSKKWGEIIEKGNVSFISTNKKKLKESGRGGEGGVSIGAKMSISINYKQTHCIVDLDCENQTQYGRSILSA